MLRSRSTHSSNGSNSYDEKPPYRRRHSVEEGEHPSQQRRRGLAAILDAPGEYRFAYAIGAAFIIYIFVLAVDRRLSSGVESFSGTGGRGGTPSAAQARAAAKQAILDASAKRVPLPAEVESAGHKVKNGFLHVDMNSRIHPIHQLIHDARQKWDAKLAKQSRTLREAVDEYQSRYYQHPPKGFEKWWRYVVEHNVELPDEYEQIHHDLYPFRAISPRNVRTLIQRAAMEEDTFGFTIRDGEVSRVSGYSLEAIHRERLDGQFDLVQDIVKWLPDMRVVYTAHDTPDTIISYDMRQELTRGVENDEYVPLEHIRADNSFTGWLAACSYNSPLRQHGYDPIPMRNIDWNEKSFIVDHVRSMDVCAHPELIPQHGLLASLRIARGTDPLSAKFAISKTLAHANVLGVPTERFTDAASVPLIPWEKKDGERLLWRGTNTGIYHNSRNHWRGTHRLRLISLTNALEGVARVLAPIVRGTVGKSAVEARLKKMNEQHTDIAFVSEPIQCDEWDGTCAEIKAHYAFRDFVTPDDLDHTKYLIDVDGNAWSARFQRLMLSGSLLFKSTIMPEWFSDRIQPWLHYVPIKVDYSDLYDSLIFFKGNDPLAKEIAQNSREWTEKFYRREDMVAYVFRLYLEWGRLQADNRAAAIYEYDEKDELVRV